MKRTAAAARKPQKKRRFPRGAKYAITAIVFAVLFAAGIIAGIIASYSNDLPDINRLADFQPSRSTRVYARDGSLLANLYRENRTWVTIDHIPVVVRNAFIATEDQHFYTHHGIDVGG
ncbi:MAG TPA: transglycosylase domain-containing protein, partial [Candidatus Acidoferrales bacterium]|nr:transglycosylase domain-containing protein [Candidatus Acidoferrales bacterium]